MNLVNVKPNTNPLPSGTPEISRPSSEQSDAEKLLCKWEWIGNTDLEEDNSRLLPAAGSPGSQGSIANEDDDEASNASFAADDIAHRRRYFQKKEHRMKPVFQPGFVYNFEVCIVLITN